MTIGDRVSVGFVMEIYGMHKDSFSNELMVQGKVKSVDVGHHYITVPASACKVIENAHVV